jgi:hypothetical protein
MAIIGLVLGFIGIVWSIGAVALGGAAFWGFGKAKQAVVLMRDGETTSSALITDLTSGNVESALSRCTSNVSREDLTRIHDQLADVGQFRGLDTPTPKITSAPGGGLQLDITDKATFEKGVKQFNLRIVQDGGAIKIDRVDLSDVP